MSAYFGIQATQQAAAQTAAAYEQAGEAKEEASRARATAFVAEQGAGLREEQLERERARGSELARRVVDHVEGNDAAGGPAPGWGTRSGAAPPAPAADLASLAGSFYPEIFDQ